ncbi:MAG: hypothetical protein ACYCOY_13740, partial [Metallibacterium sp.]
MAAATDPLATSLLRFLPADGGSLGNEALRRLLCERLGRVVDAAEYERARESLIAAGVVEKGRGRGGSLRLAAATLADLRRVADSAAAHRGDAARAPAPPLAARDASTAPRRGRAA